MALSLQLTAERANALILRPTTYTNFCTRPLLSARSFRLAPFGSLLSARSFRLAPFGSLSSARSFRLPLLVSPFLGLLFVALRPLHAWAEPGQRHGPPT